MGEFRVTSLYSIYNKNVATENTWHMDLSLVGLKSCTGI